MYNYRAFLRTSRGDAQMDEQVLYKILKQPGRQSRKNDQTASERKCY